MKPVSRFPIHRLVWGVILFTLFLLSACNFSGSDQKLTTTPEQIQFSTPTPEELGSAGNPIVFGFINPLNDPAITTAGDSLSREAANYLLLSTRAEYFPEYNSLMQAISGGKVHLAWLPPATYIYAHGRGLANVSLLSNHFGVYSYGSQFLANKASGFETSFNPVTGVNARSIPQSLLQFKDKRPCWVGTDSLSGYYVPLGILNENKIPVLPGAFLQNHPAVVRALYIRGICDFGVTFAHLGDPRTASVVLNDLTDALDQIPVIFQTDAVIPNQALVYTFNLPTEKQDALDGFFTSMIKDQQKRQNLSTALDYEIQDLQKVDDSVYNRLREILIAAGVDLQSLVGW